MTRKGGWRWWRRVEENSVWRGKACGGREGQGRVERGKVREERSQGKSVEGWMEEDRILARSVAHLVGSWWPRLQTRLVESRDQDC